MLPVAKYQNFKPKSISNILSIFPFKKCRQWHYWYWKSSGSKLSATFDTSILTSLTVDVSECNQQKQTQTHKSSQRAQATASMLTRRSADAEEPCEHAVSWYRVKCCTNVRRIAFEKACNRWITFKVIQGHYRCCHLIGYVLFPISLPSSVSCTVFEILTLICQKN